jgi:hypothetical protein
MKRISQARLASTERCKYSRDTVVRGQPIRGQKVCFMYQADSDSAKYHRMIARISNPESELPISSL